jgi:hypothetical protein
LTGARERTTIREVGGLTEYVVAMLAVVVLCVCAIVAYTGLDAIERGEEERVHWANLAATPDAPVPLARPQQRWQGGSVSAHADWLEERVRNVEEQLDRLVRDSLRAPSP